MIELKEFIRALDLVKVDDKCKRCNGSGLVRKGIHSRRLEKCECVMS